MDMINDPPRGIQKRNTFRSALLPFEITVDRLWIHDPDACFADFTTGPMPHVLLLEEGVTLRNISAGGTLIRIAAPPEISLLRVIRLPAADGEETEQPDRERYRVISLPMHLNLRKDLRDILVSCKVVRVHITRSTDKLIQYEVAARFYAWGSLNPVLQWCRVRDGNVPPVAAWITRHQLSRLR